jgi:outer membrane protein assembly factor BamB
MNFPLMKLLKLNKIFPYQKFSIYPIYPKIIFVIFPVLIYLFITLFSQKILANDFPITQCWQLPLKTYAINLSASDNVSHIPFINENIIDSIDLTTGKINWSFDAGGNIIRPIFVNSGFTYVGNIVKKKEGEENFLILRSISNYSGLTVWKNEVQIDKSLVNKITQEQAHIYDLKDNLLLHVNLCYLIVNKLNGSVKWRQCLESGSAKPNVSNIKSDMKSDIFGDTLVISDNDYIYLLALQTGELKTKISVESKAAAIQLMSESSIIYGDEKGNIYFVNTKNKKVLWTVKSGGAISDIVKTKKGVLVSSTDNFIYMLDSKTGRKIWKRRFAGRLREKTSITDNVAVIIGDEKNSYFVDISDGKIIGRISLPENEYFLQAPEFINEYYLFLTDKRALVFTNGICPKTKS